MWEPVQYHKINIASVLNKKKKLQMNVSIIKNTFWQLKREKKQQLLNASHMEKLN